MSVRIRTNRIFREDLDRQVAGLKGQIPFFLSLTSMDATGVSFSTKPNSLE
jgi:hypothetical protein